MISYYLKLRKKIGKEVIVYPAAFAAIRNKDGALLLVKKRNSTLWGFPGGGVEPEESIPNAVVREVSEEIQCRVNIGQLLAVLSSPAHDFDYDNGDSIHPIMFLFSASITDVGHFTPNDEIEKYDYFHPSNLPKMRECCKKKAEIFFSKSPNVIID